MSIGSKMVAHWLKQEAQVESAEALRRLCEFQQTQNLANRLLDAPNADPDDELRTLSRQFIRAIEREEKVAALLTNLAQILDVVKGEWAESWSAWDQEQRDAITKFLTFYHSQRA